jgi:hypothetical protein
MEDVENAGSDTKEPLDNLNDSSKGRFINIGIFIGLILLAVFGIYIKLRSPDATTAQLTATETQVAPTLIPLTASPTTTATLAIDVVQVASTPTPSTVTDSANNFTQTNYEAQISCEEISKVNLRKSPGYANKNDNEDVITEIPCDESLNLQLETKFVDGLTWWKVNWKSYEGWVSDHTGSGKTILTFTEPSSFSQSRPEEFVFWYFNALWQHRNYEDLWNNFLTTGFQNHSSDGNFNEYSKWWKTVSRIDINAIEIVQKKESSAWARININLYLTDGRVLDSRKYDYSLVFDTAKRIWMFDYP